MARITTLKWRLGIASFSLFATLAVYYFARIYPPEILTPLRAIEHDPGKFAEVFGSAPSFFYTLALGLFIGSFASTLKSARLHCVIWVGIALCLEISQHPLIAKILAGWLPRFLTEPGWAVVGPFWNRGTFDPLDLLATFGGGFIALALLTCPPVETRGGRD